MPKVVMALGNPGSQYVGTRHNIGFHLAQYIAHELQLTACQKWKSIVYKWVDNGMDIYFVQPQTYMNLSGEALKKIYRSIEVDCGDLLVVHDEVDLPSGTFRFKNGGSEAGHQGLLSISRIIGSKDYFRLRIGVGPKPPGDLSDFVLKSFSKEENDAILPLFPKLLDGIVTWIREGPEKTMNRFNGQGTQNLTED